MVSLKFRCLLVLWALAPGAIQAQAMTVLGGGQKAQECFMNAEMAARNLPGVGRSMLEPCDYTLDFSNVSQKDRAATFSNRGIVHAAINDFEAAMADHEAAIAISPSSPEFYINRGNAYFMLREYASALDDYDEAIELGIKQLHFAHYNKGMALEKLGNDKAAEQEFLKALELEPEWELVLNRLQIVRERMAEDAATQQLRQ